MKYLLYSDLHIRPERLEDCERALDQIFFVARKLRDKYGELKIINGGDTFNTRGLIHTSCFDRLHEHYEKWFNDGFKQIILIGNHDQEDRAGKVHPFRTFRSWDGWYVVDVPQVIDGMAFYPHMEIHEESDIYNHVKKGFKGDAVVHWGIRGAMRNDANVDRDGVPVEWLKKFRNVFSGHYHYRNKIENVQYIGSPLQQNFGEAGQNKGVLLYDNEANKTTFVEIKGTPKHYTLEVRHEEGKETVECKEGDVEEINAQDFVRFRVHGDADFCNAFDRDAHARAYGVTRVKVEREIRERHFSRLSIKPSEVLSPDSLATKYVEFVETSLDKKRLLSIGRELLA